ncbi:MFS transporter [Swingsia samuiensis]|uniref:MFS transporter n=1 Tax=Swingsia samuiensis TaxID=1293412 RepID=A0A4Y6UKJ0_9PROT|nr:MFS transporter [Swingsia samuiensis]QDH16535.1 MFS transporter [Swingsia samuiensis]
MLFKNLQRQAIIGLCALFVCTFTALTSEVAPVGLLINIAHAFDIPEGEAGLSVSAFALMVALGAVPLTILTGKIDRKRLMIYALSGYVVSNLIVTVAPSFAVMCMGRMIGGLSHAVLMSICAAYAAKLVPAHMTGRAISFVYGGTSLGAILGVPGAAAIGHYCGWRIAMLLITGLALVLTVCIAFFLPAVANSSTANNAIPAIRSPKAMRLFLIVTAVDAIFFLGHNLLYTYVAPLLLDHGLPSNLISVALLVSGALSILGLWGAGQVVDRWPAGGVFVSGMAMLVGMGLMYGHILSGWVSVAAVSVWCIGYTSIIPFVMSGAIRAQATRPDVAGAAINAASNVGILLGSAVGGQVLTYVGFKGLTPFAIITVLSGLILALSSSGAFPRVLSSGSETTDHVMH